MRSNRLTHHRYLKLRGQVLATLKAEKDFSTSADHLFDVVKNDLRIYSVIEAMCMNAEIVYLGKQFGGQGAAMYRLGVQFRP
jgi:hypothetical protein